jgi:hypothetical protein
MKDNILREAIINAARDFPPIDGGDPNTFDVLWIAKGLMDFTNLPLSTDLPKIEKGLAIVECVENKFIKGSLIRTLSQEELIQRTEDLLRCLRINLFNLEMVEAVTISLFIWHGCICMAKTTRISDSAGQLYNNGIRTRDYNSLKQEWEEEERRGNPWVKYGVSLARLLSKKRENKIIDDWIPPDSPYWVSL